MPRKAPDNVQEMRVTFGTYERQFVTGIKEDIEKAAKVTAVATFAVPVITGAAAAVGFGVLGYGILKAGQSIGKGLNEFSMLDWNTPDIIEDIGSGASKAKWFIPGYFLSKTKGYSVFQRSELWRWIFSNGKYGKSKEQIDAEILAVEQGGGGGDF